MARAAICAHRGGPEGDVPQTSASYRAAAQSGADYVEVDIRRTRDGVLVAYHDACCGPGDGHDRRAVADLSYDEMCAHVGYPVPRADEAMEALAGRVAGHLDLKAP